MPNRKCAAGHCNGLFVPGERTPYTVTLIYPDYLANQYGEDFFTDWAEARTAPEAVQLVQKKACEASDMQVNDPCDFAVVTVFSGHLSTEVLD